MSWLPPDWPALIIAALIVGPFLAVVWAWGQQA